MVNVHYYYAQIMSKYLVISPLIGGDTLYNSENNNYAQKIPCDKSVNLG